MVNFEWYRTFKAIYQTGTLTGAAQELSISQPNVSQHLSALEHYTGQQLFERKPRKMVPTDFGKLFYTQIIEAVEKLEIVETDFRESCVQDCMPVTRIGAPREFFEAIMAPHISQVPAHLIFEFGITKDLMQKLNKGELDFVIATHCTERNVVYEPVLKERFHLVGSTQLDTTLLSEALAAGNLVQAEQWLAAQDWFAYSGNLMIIRRFWLNNFRKRPPVRPRYIIPDFSSILTALIHGKGVTIASDYLVCDLINKGQLQKLWATPTDTHNTLYLTYDKAHVTSKQITTMQSLFKGLALPLE